METKPRSGDVRPWRLLLLITVALIVYASLYPWQFDKPHPPGSPLPVLLREWPREANRFLVRDAFLNLLVYVPVGAFGFLSFSAGRHRVLRTLAPVVLAFLLSSSIELAQVYDRSRTASIVDLAMNVSGAGAGILVGGLRGPLLVRIAAAAGLDAAFAAPGPVLLLFCWAGYLVFPPIPLLGRTRLVAKLTAFWSAPSFSATEAAAGVVDWLAVALLLETGARGRPARVPLLLLMALLPARLLLASRPLTWTELAAATVALVLWNAWVRRIPGRVTLLAWVAAGALVLRGLAPYHLTEAARPFGWVPFQASFESENAAAAAILLRKSFLYGASIWLFHASGRRWIRSAAGIAALLAGIEIVQRYLPGRTPEITDPVLAILLAAVLAMLARRSPGRSLRGA